MNFNTHKMKVMINLPKDHYDFLNLLAENKGLTLKQEIRRIIMNHNLTVEQEIKNRQNK